MSLILFVEDRLYDLLKLFRLHDAEYVTANPARSINDNSHGQEIAYVVPGGKLVVSKFTS